MIFTVRDLISLDDLYRLYLFSAENHQEELRILDTHKHQFTFSSEMQQRYSHTSHSDLIFDDFEADNSEVFTRLITNIISDCDAFLGIDVSDINGSYTSTTFLQTENPSSPSDKAVNFCFEIVVPNSQFPSSFKKRIKLLSPSNSDRSILSRTWNTHKIGDKLLIKWYDEN